MQGYPLFPGENEVEQLSCIMEILGTPPKRLLDDSTRKKLFFDSGNVYAVTPTTALSKMLTPHVRNLQKPRIVPNSRGRKRHPGTKDLMTAVKCSDPLFIDFLQNCLRWEPKQ